MNKDLKRKYNLVDEKDERNAKKVKLNEDELNEALKNAHFPIVDKETRIPLAPLIPEYLKVSKQYKQFIEKNSGDKELERTFSCYLYASYDKIRFLLACALLAGGNPNFFYRNDYSVLTIASIRTDYWLAYLALLCGADPNYNRKCSRPLELAYAHEMAELLLKWGALIDPENTLLAYAAEFRSWKLFKFYLDKNLVWRNEVWNIGRSPFEVCIESLRFVMDVDSCLRKIKLLFLAGYRDENGEVLNKLRDGKLLFSSETVFKKVIQDPTFSLDLCLYQRESKNPYLYRTHSSERDNFKPNPLREEQKRMYDFGKNNHYTDVSILYKPLF